jgi:hypothetical protein
MIRRVVAVVALLTGVAGAATGVIEVATQAAPTVSQSAPVCILAITTTAPHYLCIAASGVDYR